jgi:hypothetical protein
MYQVLLIVEKYGKITLHVGGKYLTAATDIAVEKHLHQTGILDEL